MTCAVLNIDWNVLCKNRGINLWNHLKSKQYKQYKARCNTNINICFIELHDYLFVDTYKSNNIKIGVNDMTVNDSEMCVIWKDEAWSKPDISVLRQPKWIQTKVES